MPQLDFKIEKITKDGKLLALINARRYLYYIDHAKAMQVWRMHFRTPGKALAYLKKVAHSYEKQ